ncbi:hypothetical protein [Pseudoteredinibacter isoporae]|uniref:hypothetical protein n=1 Tax=Pseudoteredinibacter isoporae TaxID=570281 RepID=UPI00333F0FB5
MSSIKHFGHLTTLAAMAASVMACVYAPGQQHSELGLSFGDTQTHKLVKALEETSGLAQHGGLLWTHNDSGDKARIYAMNEQGDIQKTILIENGHNFDWEEMAHDKQHLYVADIGDNFGQREESYLYRLAWSDLEKASDNASVQATKMTVRIAGKPKQVPNKEVHNFDFEGLTSVGDELWLFSKNRQDGHSSLYRLTKDDAEQTVSASASYPVDMLVTAVDFDQARNEFAILGYQLGWNGMSSFLWRVKRSADTRSLDWSSAQRYDIEPDGQWEAVVWDRQKAGLLWLSREGNQQADVALAKTQF